MFSDVPFFYYYNLRPLSIAKALAWAIKYLIKKYCYLANSIIHSLEKFVDGRMDIRYGILPRVKVLLSMAYLPNLLSSLLWFLGEKAEFLHSHLAKKKPCRLQRYISI